MYTTINNYIYILNKLKPDEYKIAKQIKNNNQELYEYLLQCLVVEEQAASLPQRRQHPGDDEAIIIPESAYNNTQHPCPKCGQRKCYTTTKQLKSADEGMSNVAVCICKKEWILN